MIRTPAAACRCGHGADWHSEGGAGDCEHNGDCACEAFVPIVYDADRHEWNGQCPHGDVCTGCDALGYCTHEEACEPAAACEHDWRLNRSWDTTSYMPAPDPQFTTAVITPTVFTIKHDEWYCTKCRLIEERVRV